jgi:hypothetical protein
MMQMGNSISFPPVARSISLRWSISLFSSLRRASSVAPVWTPFSVVDISA